MTLDLAAEARKITAGMQHTHSLDGSDHYWCEMCRIEAAAIAALERVTESLRADLQAALVQLKLRDECATQLMQERNEALETAAQREAWWRELDKETLTSIVSGKHWELRKLLGLDAGDAKEGM